MYQLLIHRSEQNLSGPSMDICNEQHGETQGDFGRDHQIQETRATRPAVLEQDYIRLSNT